MAPFRHNRTSRSAPVIPTLFIRAFQERFNRVRARTREGEREATRAPARGSRGCYALGVEIFVRSTSFHKNPTPHELHLDYTRSFRSASSRLRAAVRRSLPRACARGDAAAGFLSPRASRQSQKRRGSRAKRVSALRFAASSAAAPLLTRLCICEPRRETRRRLFASGVSR